MSALPSAGEDEGVDLRRAFRRGTPDKAYRERARRALLPLWESDIPHTVIAKHIGHPPKTLRKLMKLEVPPSPIIRDPNSLVRSIIWDWFESHYNPDPSLDESTSPMPKRFRESPREMESLVRVFSDRSSETDSD